MAQLLKFKTKKVMDKRAGKTLYERTVNGKTVTMWIPDAHFAHRSARAQYAAAGWKKSSKTAEPVGEKVKATKAKGKSETEELETV